MTSMSKEVTYSSLETGSEKLKPGTTLLTCEPFVYSGYISSPGLPFCDTCLIIKKDGCLRPCESCFVVQYCSAPCKEKGWREGHQHECKWMKHLLHVFKSAPKLIWDVRILLRLIVKLQDGTDYYDELDIGSTKVKRRFSDLISHSGKLDEDKDFMEQLQRLFQILRLLLAPESKFNIPTDKELAEMFGKVHTNAFEIGDGFYTVGSGLYLGGSIFNHSCNPTVTRIFNGTTMYVRNMMEIPKSMPIDQVTLSYVSTLEPTEERRKALKKNYHFHCECERCETGQLDKEMRSVTCPNDGCNGKIDTKDLNDPCSVCGHIIKTEVAAKVLEAEKYAVQLIASSDSEFHLVEECVKKLKTLNFSDLHWVVLKLFDELYDTAGKMGIREKEKAFEYGSKYILGLRRYLGPCNPTLLRFLIEVSFFAFRIGKLDEAEKYMAEARSIAEVLHGEKSAFIQSRIDPPLKQIRNCKK